jgi:CRP-like cAMP-binding protein
MKKNTLMETLAEIHFLDGASPAHLEQIAAVAQIREYDKSDIIFREGEIADSVYLVVSGKLSLELLPSTTERKQIVNVGPGEMLGWSSLIEQPRFAAAAVVVEPTRLVQIDATRLWAICDEDPRFGYDFMRRAVLALAKRLTTTWRQLSHLHISHYSPVPAVTGESDD